jgi:hypothetical protein
MSLANKGISLEKLWKGEARQKPELMEQAVRGLMDEDQMKAAGLKAIEPMDFSIRELLDFCLMVDRGKRVGQVANLAEEVAVSQFPTLTATLLEKELIKAFDLVPTIADQLVDPFKSTQQNSTVPGADLTSTFHDIEPGERYRHDADIAEKYVTIAGSKRGAILDVQEESVIFDQTGLVLREAARFGRQAAMDREKRMLYTIQDATVSGTNYYAYYPSGTRVALYSGTVATTHPYSNLMDHALQHWTDIDRARVMFSAMRDPQGDPIVISPKILLVPEALKTVANRLISNTMMPAARVGQTRVGDSQMEANPYANAFQVISSPFLDIVDSRTWYLGDFKSQFLLKQVYPLQVLVRRDKTNDAAWERDVLVSTKVRWWEQVGATDYKYVVKSRGTYGTCGVGSYCTSWDEAEVP